MNRHKDLELILKKVAMSTIKDTDFSKKQGIDGTEEIPIVHENTNKLMNVSTLLNEINSSIIIIPEVSSLTEALSTISVYKRRKGMIVGFIPKGSNKYEYRQYIGNSTHTSDFTAPTNWVEFSLGTTSNLRGLFPTELALHNVLNPSEGELAFVGKDFASAIVYEYSSHKGWVSTYKPFVDVPSKKNVLYSKPTTKILKSPIETPIAERAYKDHLGRNISETYLTKCELSKHIKDIIQTSNGINVTFIDNNDCCKTNNEEEMFTALYDRLRAIFNPISLEDIRRRLTIRGNALFFGDDKIGDFRTNHLDTSYSIPSLKSVRLLIDNNSKDILEASISESGLGVHYFTNSTTFNILPIFKEGINRGEYRVRVVEQGTNREIDINNPITITDNKVYMIYGLRTSQGGDTPITPNQPSGGNSEPKMVTVTIAALNSEHTNTGEYYSFARLSTTKEGLDSSNDTSITVQEGTKVYFKVFALSNRADSRARVFYKDTNVEVYKEVKEGFIGHDYIIPYENTSLAAILEAIPMIRVSWTKTNVDGASILYGTSPDNLSNTPIEVEKGTRIYWSIDEGSSHNAANYNFTVKVFEEKEEDTASRLVEGNSMVVNYNTTLQAYGEASTEFPIEVIIGYSGEAIPQNLEWGFYNENERGIPVYTTTDTSTVSMKLGTHIMYIRPTRGNVSVEGYESKRGYVTIKESDNTEPLRFELGEVIDYTITKPVTIIIGSEWEDTNEDSDVQP